MANNTLLNVAKVKIRRRGDGARCITLLPRLRAFVIADIVKLECLRKPGTPDHDVLADWFSRMGNRIRIEDTGMKGVYEAAIACERSGEKPRATSGYGDADLAHRLRRLDIIAGADDIPLVLLEDSKAARSLQRYDRAHILSMRA